MSTRAPVVLKRDPITDPGQKNFSAPAHNKFISLHPAIAIFRDWLSLYPPLSRFKPVQAFLIGRLAYIESVQSVLDIFTAAK